MNYIINPMWFYWLSICDALKAVFSFASLAGFIGLVFGIIFLIDEFEKPGKPIASLILLELFFAFGAIFIPSETTMCKMMIAEQVTTENITVAKDVIKDTCDYIIDAVKEVSGKDD